MLINAQNLRTLGVGFRASFMRGLGQAASQWGRVATRVPSTTAAEEYGWLGKIPNVREWIGPRHVQNMAAHDYRIKNRDFELTLGVDRNHISDDNIGIYGPMFEEMGMSTGAHFDMEIFGLLKRGFDEPCYDGQAFFDADHPVLDENGETISVSNTGGGSGTAWYLMVANRPLRPLLLQVRKDFDFVAKDAPTDENVFNNKEFVYGSDCRMNVGFGFWQFAFGSKQTLNATNYEAARAALTGMKGDHGRPLGLVPNLLVVPPTLEGAGRRLLQSLLVNGGESNPWANSAELVVVPWLA